MKKHAEKKEPRAEERREAKMPPKARKAMEQKEMSYAEGGMVKKGKRGC